VGAEGIVAPSRLVGATLAGGSAPSGGLLEATRAAGGTSLIRARGRGVQISMILGKLDQGRNRQVAEEDVYVTGQVWQLGRAGIRVLHNSLFNHQKALICDRRVVLSGSINLTRARRLAGALARTRGALDSARAPMCPVVRGFCREPRRSKGPP